MSGDGRSKSPNASRRERFDEILAELMRAVDAGQSVEPDEWLVRYPEFAADLKEYFEKHERVERLVRPLRQAAAQVLHVRCPHCHHPIELLEDARLDEVSCPSCGSSFSLVGENTVSHYLPGEKTIGHFQLLDRVGIGAFGSVWKARDTQLDRTVAVKIPRNTQLDKSQAELFLRDARAAAQLKHPNIVSVHEVGKQDGTIYIVSDFIQGATLKEWTEAKRLTPRETAELCVKIAKALHHAHEFGVIHRDLKPGNIMMDTDGDPHIVDFGLAKRNVGEITMTIEGQILGTPAYMSPEQARGEGHTVDRRADIYSLGVVLFELLTGELPFRGDKQMLIVQILKDDAPSPRQMNGSVPRDLETIGLKCLEKEPARRYDSGLSLAHDLERFLFGEPIHARPISRWERSWRWCQRSPVVSTLSAVTLVLLLAVAFVATQAYLNELNRRLEVEALVENLDNASDALERLGAEKYQLEKKKAVLEENVDVLTARRKKLDQELYVARMNLARMELNAEHIVSADRHLEDCPQRLRDQDWHALKNLIYPRVRQFAGQGCVAVSPSGKWIAAVCQDGNVSVWNLQSGDVVFSLRTDGDIPTALAFSPDDSRLAGAVRTNVYVWELNHDDQTPRRLQKQLSWVTDVDFHPDGQTLAFAKNDNVVLWNLETDETREFPGARYVTFDPNGRYLATAGLSKNGDKFMAYKSGFQPHHMICVWDLSKRPLDASAVIKSFATARDFRCRPVFSSDGNNIALVSSSYQVEVWNFEEDRYILRQQIGHVQSLAFSPGGGRLACGGIDTGSSHRSQSGRIVLLNLSSANKQILPWHEKPVTDLAFSGDQLVAVDEDSVKVWDVRPLTNPTADIQKANSELNVGVNDYALWGGSNARVNAPAGTDIPLDWDVGDIRPWWLGAWKERARPSESKNIKWAARLGSQAYGNPIVANGNVFVGTNNASGYLDRYPANVDLGVLLCFDEQSGNFLWQQSNEKLKTGRVHDWPYQGVCSTPLVDGDRLWFVSNRGEVLCLDTKGFLDGEDDGIEQGVWAQDPWREVPLEEGWEREADVVWRFDMRRELDVSPHNMSNCSVITADGKLFVCTSNGLDASHVNLRRPDAPSFICMDRETAEVLWTSNLPGENILHAQWASPSYGVFEGQPQVIFPGGDGWVYSFDPEGDGKGGAKLLWKFDGNPKQSQWSLGGRGTRNSIIAFPAIYDGLVYITMGQDPEHGEGRGRLWCITPTKRGDVSAELAVDADGNILPHRRLQAVDLSQGERAIPNPNSAAVWHYDQFDQNGDGDIEFEEEFHRSMGIPAIKDDILYVADFSGLFHCLHAKTGRVYWTYDMFAQCWGSALVVDGKVYIGDEDGEISIFRHSADPRIAMQVAPEEANLRSPINVVDMGASMYMTPIVANDVLYIASQTTLFAISKDEATSAQSQHIDN